MTHLFQPARSLRWVRPALAILASAASGVVLSQVGPPWVLIHIPISLAASFAVTRRRWRFPAAVWLGSSGFFFLLLGQAGHSQGFWVALVFAAAAIAALWPMLRGTSELAPLPPLPATWVLLSTLALVATDAALLGTQTDVGRHDQALVASAFGWLILFSSMMLGSLVGRGRWVLQLLGSLFAAAPIMAISSGNKPSVIPWLTGAVAIALAFDWIRSPVGSAKRFLRGAGVCLALSLVPVLVASPHQLLSWGPLLSALARAMAFGVSAGLAPRACGPSRPRSARPMRFGLPSLAVGIVGVLTACAPLVAGFLSRAPEVYWMCLTTALVLALPMVIRARFARALLWLSATALLFGVILAGLKEGSGLAAVGCLLAFAGVVFVARAVSSPKGARHFFRRWRCAAYPVPKASLALAAGVVTLSAVLLQWQTKDVEHRGLLLAQVEGPIPLAAPLLFHAPIVHGAPAAESAVGSAVATDPLGRGVWVVDEEGDAVSLVRRNRLIHTVKVDRGPAQLVAQSNGRVFVSCRQSGRIDAIDEDFSVQSVDIGTEVRGLALDEPKSRLYIGLLLERELWAVDTRSLQVVGRRPLPVEPRTLAVTPQGVAILPGLGSSVAYVKEDFSSVREVPLFHHGRRSWHGQALLPVGRDLIVIHASVDTGLTEPVSAGGYGGNVNQPVELVATVLENGEPTPYPPSVDARRTLEAAEITGLAIREGQLFLASRGTDEVLQIPLAELHHPKGNLSKVANVKGPSGLVAVRGNLVTFGAFSRRLTEIDPLSGTEGCGVPLGKGRLNPELALGRALFHQANGPEISSAGLACATCHPDGREDGLVWRLQGLRLQTPSLAGRLADTAPYNWHGTQPTLEGNIEQTIDRLGGTGLSSGEVHALALFIRDGLPTPKPRDVPHTALIAQGERLFHDSKVGCSGCHLSDSGFTDGARHDVGSMSAAELNELSQVLAEAEIRKSESKKAKTLVDLKDAKSGFDTPSLRNVGLTPPYFHDGSAPTLEALIENNHDRMGQTSHLTSEERRALVAYLRTL